MLGNGSFPRLRREPAEGRKAGHQLFLEEKRVDYTPRNFVDGEDGIYTTLDDMVRWVTAIDEQKLVKLHTWQEAFTPGQ